MAENDRYNHTTTPQTDSFSVARDDREQILLDDLRVEIARLADAVERQNELLDEHERARSEVRHE